MRLPVKINKSALVDYHLHTLFSDGGETHQAIITSAFSMGLAEIGFSDHICLNNIHWAMPVSRISEMVDTLDRFRETAPIKVRFGIEMDYLPEYETEISRLIASLPLDYVIGSVHFIDDWNFDSESHLDVYRNWNTDDLYKRYFSLVQQAARTGLFDILGHLDLIKKFGIRPKKPLHELLEETVTVIGEHDICIELNTSGLGKPCHEMYPSQTILGLCHSHDVPITLGSDAHSAGSVGQYYAEAVTALEQAGYSRICHFERRQRTKVDLFSENA